MKIKLILWRDEVSILSTVNKYDKTIGPYLSLPIPHLE